MTRDPPEASSDAPPERDGDPMPFAPGDESSHDAAAPSGDSGPEPEGWVLL